MRAEFTDNLITGNDMIDSQHKELIEKINQDLTAKKQTEIAVDTVGAGDGETVIVVGGSSARMSGDGDKKNSLPVDAAIVGIVDTVEVSQC